MKRFLLLLFFTVLFSFVVHAQDRVWVQTFNDRFEGNDISAYTSSDWAVHSSSCYEGTYCVGCTNAADGLYPLYVANSSFSMDRDTYNYSIHMMVKDEDSSNIGWTGAMFSYSDTDNLYYYLLGYIGGGTDKNFQYAWKRVGGSPTIFTPFTDGETSPAYPGWNYCEATSYVNDTICYDCWTGTNKSTHIYKDCNPDSALEDGYLGIFARNTYANVDNISIWREESVVVEAAPVLSNYNLTSSLPSGCSSFPCETNDTTPTIKFDTDVDSNCRIDDADLNYTTMPGTGNCTTTGGQSHICTLNPLDVLTSATDYIYLACITTPGGSENTTSSTPSGLEIDLSGIIGGGVCNGSGGAYATQYVEVIHYNNTHIFLNLTVAVHNPSTTTSLSNIDVTPPAGFGSVSNNNAVGTNDTVLVSFTNISYRAMNDQWWNISGSAISGDFAMTTNSIDFLNPIDPPSAIYKNDTGHYGTYSCANNPVYDDLFLGNLSLHLVDSGVFLVNSVFNIKNLTWEGGCMINFKPGSLYFSSVYTPPVNNTAPVVESTNQAYWKSTVQTDTTRDYNLTCSDNESSPTYDWYVDGSLNYTGDTYTFYGSSFSIGSHTIIGSCTDGSLSDNRTFQVEVEEGDIITFIQYPDIHYGLSGHNWNYVIGLNTSTWIADQKDGLNVVWVSSVGDVVSYGNTTMSDWDEINATMNILTNAEVKWSLLMGNHDYDDFDPQGPTRLRNTFNNYFSYEKMDGLNLLNGTWDGNYTNNYELFEAEGIKFGIINIEDIPWLSVLEWANDTVKAYPDRYWIVATHDYLEFDGTRTVTSGGCAAYGEYCNRGDKIWDYFVKYHSNIFLVISGHVAYDSEHATTAYLNSTGVNGNQILQMFADYQEYNYNNDSFIKTFTIRPSQGIIQARTFSVLNVSYDVTPPGTQEYNFSYNFTQISYSSCYQEYADANASGCGADTGADMEDAGWNVGGRVFDGDYSTSDAGGIGQDAYAYVNYTLPSSYVRTSFWQVKDFEGVQNLSVPSDCWDYADTEGKLMLLFRSFQSGGTSYWYCTNASTNKLLRSYASNLIYEEGMWWNISS